MVIDSFRKSIESSNKVLQPFGIQLYEMLMNGEKEMLESIVNSFVAIAAIQVCFLYYNVC